MADVTYRANLKTSSFPFLSSLFGRSIIVKGQDQNYVGGLATKETADSSIGVPQIYYAENVIPTDNGYKSVYYEEAVPDSSLIVSDVLTIRDASGNSALITVTTAGVVKVMEKNTYIWVDPITPPTPATIAGKRMTVAFVSGISYIFFETIGCWEYNWTTNAMTVVTFTSITIASVLGVVGNKGYLVIYSSDTIAWSTTFTAGDVDFTPSLVTGAGDGQVEGARGTIVTVESVYGGMVVFTDTNAVAAIVTDNSRYPYNFVEITGAGGLQDSHFVSYDGNSSILYAYTTAGVQQISLKEAKTVFGEVTDFLSGDLFESFNYTTNTLTTTSAAGAVIQKRMVIVASRYLVISYGILSLTDALLLDLVNKQWGKLKISHVDCFEYIRDTVEVPKNSIAFMASNGSITILDPDIAISGQASGVMILGKYQYVRSRLLQLQRVQLENINVDDTFALYDLPAADGKNFGTPIVGYLHTNSGYYREYLFHNTAMNHSLLFKGTFNAVSLQLIFNVSGAR